MLFLALIPFFPLILLFSTIHALPHNPIHIPSIANITSIPSITIIPAPACHPPFCHPVHNLTSTEITSGTPVAPIPPKILVARQKNGKMVPEFPKEKLATALILNTDLWGLMVNGLKDAWKWFKGLFHKHH